MTSDLPTPAAARLRRPSWRDGRLIVGLLIVLGSTAIGARVVAAADHTVPVYAANYTLPAGRVVGGADLRVVRVHLGRGAADYLSATQPLPSGSTLLRVVGEGELVPTSAIGPAGSLLRRPVTIPLDRAVPVGLRTGARVDVWSSARDPASGATAFSPPTRLAVEAEVFSVLAGGTSLTASQSSSVQVLLAEKELRSVLDALANGARLALVPAPGSAPPGHAAGGSVA